MTTKASGRAALILTVGMVVGFAAPSYAADPSTDAASVTTSTNPADPQAGTAGQAAGSDQLSDADRAARQDDVKAPVIVTQSQNQPDAASVRASPVVAGSQNATWDETSLIGKIFIGFGALLTVASAARMFMA
jgi:hypothetical protein